VRERLLVSKRVLSGDSFEQVDHPGELYTVIASLIFQSSNVDPDRLASHAHKGARSTAKSVGFIRDIAGRHFIDKSCRDVLAASLWMLPQRDDRFSLHLRDLALNYLEEVPCGWEGLPIFHTGPLLEGDYRDVKLHTGHEVDGRI